MTSTSDEAAQPAVPATAGDVDPLDERLTDEPGALRSRIPAGLVDSGLASLATFGVGLIATRILDAPTLGVYALFFAAFNFGSVIPRTLVLAPAELISLEHPRRRRLTLLPGTIGYGLALALAPVAVVLAVALFGSSVGSTEVLVAFAVTTGLAAIVSPIQDHIRRMQHLADHSWVAASMSAVQLVVAAGSLAVLVALDIDEAWVPFAALFLANLASSTVGIVAARVMQPGRTKAPPVGEVLRSGRWFLVGSLVPTGATLIAAAIIATLAGTVALGQAEAARIVAHPLYVLAFGVGAVVAPRIMEASRDKDWVGTRTMRRVFLLATVPLALIYGLITATDWFLNPMAYLVPAAYTVSGLVALTLVANLADIVSRPYASELLGSRRERLLAIRETAIGPIPIIVAFTAGVTGAFARPLGLLAAALARIGLFNRAVAKLHASR